MEEYLFLCTSLWNINKITPSKCYLKCFNANHINLVDLIFTCISSYKISFSDSDYLASRFCFKKLTFIINRWVKQRFLDCFCALKWDVILYFGSKGGNPFLRLHYIFTLKCICQRFTFLLYNWIYRSTVGTMAMQYPPRSVNNIEVMA